MQKTLIFAAMDLPLAAAVRQIDMYSFCVCSRYSCLQRKKSLSQQLITIFLSYTNILVSSVVPLGKILLFRGFNNNKCPSCVLNIFCRTVLMIDYGFLFPSSIAIVIAQCDYYTWVWEEMSPLYCMYRRSSFYADSVYTDSLYSSSKNFALSE